MLLYSEIVFGHGSGLQAESFLLLQLSECPCSPFFSVAWSTGNRANGMLEPSGTEKPPTMNFLETVGCVIGKRHLGIVVGEVPCIIHPVISKARWDHGSDACFVYHPVSLPGSSDFYYVQIGYLQSREIIIATSEELTVIFKPFQNECAGVVL